MLHDVTYGRSFTGKTKFNQARAAATLDAGRLVAVLDPLLDPAWGVDVEACRAGWRARLNKPFITSDRLAFLRWAQCSADAELFIDESGTALDRYDQADQWLATTSRHQGHAAHFLAHYPAQLHPAIRAQCQKMLVVFSSNLKHARALADEYGDQRLALAAQLPPLRFLVWRPFLPLLVGRLDFKRGRPIPTMRHAA